MSICAPRLALRPLADTRWTTMADIIRFREDTRPAELLYQGVVHTQTGGRDVYFISDPDAIATILQTDSRNFPKAPANYRIGYRAFGPSIAGTRGPANQRQRKAFAPLFGGPALRRMAPVNLEAAKAAVARWSGCDRLDLSRAASRLALDISWSMFLGPGHYTPASDQVEALFDRLLSIPKSDMTAQLAVLGDLVDELVRSGRDKILRHDNPISQISCPMGSGGAAPLSQREIYANAMNMALVGFASTGNCLAWGLWVLGQVPDFQDSLRRRARQGQPITGALQALYREVLRLWPPAPDALRLANRTLAVQGHTIAPGAHIMVCPYALHRRADIWPDPDRFDVHRFAGVDTTLPRHQTIWPFSGGNHRCPGQAFAWAELVSVTAVLIQSFRISVAVDEASQVGLKVGALLDPDRPLMAQLDPIEPNTNNSSRAR